MCYQTVKDTAIDNSICLPETGNISTANSWRSTTTTWTRSVWGKSEVARREGWREREGGEGLEAEVGLCKFQQLTI